MRKSRGEKVFEAARTREDDSKRGARVQKRFFADIRGWELVFYARLRNEFRAFSIPCHATLSIVGRDALFQR